MTALKTYIDQLDKQALGEVAELCKCSVGHLRNCAYGSRQVSAGLARKLEIVSNGQVKRKELREDWEEIWPELAKKGRK